ncbi:hypothetical protein LR48_Vigan03g011900 [Vigna angularis]|uniref:DUF4378 domain-containing protein n=2 Tax=Phaseolus angularis TaxID=3914 RepID=A0A0L9U1N8_PHAAN|nr:uncharacterized protein LOC108327046 [Vigna angularis]XP_017416216.1 uncharacterized protein LOC108327046 [Vigna angularis]XP_017416217.1 uncharacterized protein LOC108327046 [Vigna angularis]XP_017416218.1 uncharacterized protein LOC108327046 [Vigna angularis]XP_052729277.1 uncharacterized protein LOC108327046 [Vigna angularis]XP_052729278.1 uncharacterized protein LOC108327046 [Vigna angularis]XP_052729279.1 uncharacterized protein LOC108327046 [Vigna angularis]XP_052729280.1 uncharacte
MESKEAASVILNLMGLDKVPNQHPVRDKQKVLSENYQQKVASIGVRRKRSSHQHHSFGMNTSEKDKSEDVLEVFKALRRSKHHNPSKGNGKENPGSSKNSQLADGLLQEIGYPEKQYRKKKSSHMNFGKPSSRSFSKISEEISMQSGNVANGALHSASTSFFRGNEVLSNDMLKPALNISVNEIQFNFPIFCSDGSYIGSQARRKTLEQRDVTEKVHELRPFGRDCIHSQLHMIWEKGNGARNLTHQRGYGNVRIKADDNYSFARRVPRPLCSASALTDNCGTMNQDILFHRYWGLRKNASSNWSSWNSKYQYNGQKECLEDVNLSSGGEKFPSFCSYFNSDHTELPSSSSSPTFIDEQMFQERNVMNDEVKNRKYDDSNMWKQNVVSLHSSVEFLVSDATAEVVDWTHSPTEHQSKSTAFVLSQEIDCLNHTSYTSKQQDRSDFNEGSVHLLCHEVHPDSLGSSVESYEPSPISVLDPLFGEDIQFGYKSDDHIYDSSEVDDEECGLNVSSDEDCENEYAHNSQEKKEIAGLVRAEESRDFSYAVEVLTEASIFNRNLFTDFSTWHSSQCPISPSVFENLEKKFGQQQFWSRSERKLLFDRINIGLIQILEPCLFVPMWEKSTSRRLNVELNQNIIEDEMWGLLVVQEKKASNEYADHTLEGKIRWTELVEDVEDIVTEIVNLVTEELANEIVLSVNF